MFFTPNLEKKEHALISLRVVATHLRYVQTSTNLRATGKNLNRQNILY